MEVRLYVARCGGVIWTTKGASGGGSASGILTYKFVLIGVKWAIRCQPLLRRHEPVVLPVRDTRTLLSNGVFNTDISKLWWSRVVHHKTVGVTTC
jgi:hypothetical protein